MSETPTETPAKTAVQALDELLRGVERAAWGVRGWVDAASQTKRTWGRELSHVRLSAKRRKRQLTSESQRALLTGRMLLGLVSSYRWFGIRSAWLARDQAAEDLESLHAQNAARFTAASIEHGGALLKVGQLLSARRDLLPAVWTDELARLCDQVPAAPEAEARELLARELSEQQRERVVHIEWPPVAAASIGQVHRATIQLEGEQRVAALKLQRPGIGGRVAMDLELLELVADALASSLPPMDHATIVAEVRATVMAELDYREEAKAMQRMHERFATQRGVRVPAPFAALCTERVLMSEWVDGRPLTAALDAAQAAGERAVVSSILERLLSVYVEQILVHGEFQADAHPGNFLVTESGDLVLLDFGCVRRLEPSKRRAFGRIFADLLTGDASAVADQLMLLGFRTQSGRPDTLLHFAESMLGDLRGALTGSDWPDLDQVAERARELLSAAQADPVVSIPAEFVMIGRVFASLGGLFLHYRPEIDMAKAVLPHLSALALEGEAVS